MQFVSYFGTVESNTIKEAMQQYASQLAVEGPRTITASAGTMQNPQHPIIHVSLYSDDPDYWTDKAGRMHKC